VNEAQLFDPGPPVDKPPRAGARIADFDAWWAAYPLKVAKRAAHTKWITLATKRELPELDDLLLAVERYKQSEPVKRGFIAHPATWLNQGRWTDQLEVPEEKLPAPECAKCGVVLVGMISCPMLDRQCAAALPS